MGANQWQGVGLVGGHCLWWGENFADFCKSSTMHMTSMSHGLQVQPMDLSCMALVPAISLLPAGPSLVPTGPSLSHASLLRPPGHPSLARWSYPPVSLTRACQSLPLSPADPSLSRISLLRPPVYPPLTHPPVHSSFARWFLSLSCALAPTRPSPSRLPSLSPTGLSRRVVRPLVPLSLSHPLAGPFLSPSSPPRADTK
jgi:hypothetical protein